MNIIALGLVLFGTLAALFALDRFADDEEEK